MREGGRSGTPAPSFHSMIRLFSWDLVYPQTFFNFTTTTKTFLRPNGAFQTGSPFLPRSTLFRLQSVCIPERGEEQVPVLVGPHQLRVQLVTEHQSCGSESGVFWTVRSGSRVSDLDPVFPQRLDPDLKCADLCKEIEGERGK